MRVIEAASSRAARSAGNRTVNVDPRPGSADDIHCPAVRDHNRSNEAQPKPEPPFRTTLVAPIQAIPDMREVVRRDADAGIRHIEAHDRPFSTRR